LEAKRGVSERSVERRTQRRVAPASSVALPAQRVVIEGVLPQIDGGRYPVKRVVGDVVTIGADVYKDGHDLLGARIAYRAPDERQWAYAPMTYDEPQDRWSGSFRVDRVGRWSYTVEGWSDTFATWRSELGKKIAAGQDVASELLEGAALIAAAARRAKSAARASLVEVAARLRDRSAPVAERSAAGLAQDVATVMAEFGERAVTRYERELEIIVDREAARFAAWYEMFPRSQGTIPGRHGTFADAARRLPELATLGFDVVYLPPIHPIGHTHRKGKNNSLDPGPDDVGSPWAIGDETGGHTAIDPQLGTIDDFDRFVRSANAAGMEVALDYALQCSPDHPWLREHPDWFQVRPDGTIKYAENPPKKYQDIVPLDFWCEDREALWTACRDVVLFWISHGVKIFRVDNPHTKPFAFWEWMIADLQRAHPDVVFLSEAFTRPKRMKGLAKLGFTQSYTYFTWRNAAGEIREYFDELFHTEMVEYFRGNLFVNTPDILHEYLQKGGRPAFLVRLLLAGTLSPLYGMYSGFELVENTPLRPGSEEYLDSEKFEIRVRDWHAPGNIREEIATLNRVRRENPALRLYGNVTFLPSENETILFYWRAAPEGDLLIAVNVDPFRVQATMVHVPLDRLRIGPDELYIVEDLLTGARYPWRGVRNYVRLDPVMGQAGHVLRVERGATR
jgi:starch synthase (maltosyl-transferring)